MMPTCGFCTDEATGLDEDGGLTCGDMTCAPAVAELPRVLESSGENDDVDPTENYAAMDLAWDDR